LEDYNSNMTGLEERWAVAGSFIVACSEAQLLLKQGHGVLNVLAALIRTATVFKEVR
jgi:hypothetical protein